MDWSFCQAWSEDPSLSCSTLTLPALALGPLGVKKTKRKDVPTSGNTILTNGVELQFIFAFVRPGQKTLSLAVPHSPFQP